MAEILNGQRPFDGYKFDLKLAVKICKGLRPEFAPGTPKCYIELAEKCMNSNPQERPDAWDVHKTIDNWFKKIARLIKTILKNFTEKSQHKNNKL